MARQRRRGIVGLYVDADMSQGVETASFLEHFCREMSTEAHVDTVLEATHTIFADEFDKYMKGVAGTKRENFFHVYEYSSGQDAFEYVGNPSFKLWQHTRLGRGKDLTFSWTWLPAKNPNPTYEQRRESDVGRDGIRELSEEDYQELLDRSAGRVHKFVWKAPVLEHEIVRTVYPKGKMLMVPRGGKKYFFHNYVATQQHPGPTKGAFTEQWIAFWGGIVPTRWYKVVGEQIEIDAKRRIEEGIATTGKKPRKEKRKFQARTFNNMEDAKEAGREQAISALRTHSRTIKDMEKNRGRFTR